MILKADARHIPLADDSVNCVVTSPPYWGLRKYAGEQELVWGGTKGCGHEWASFRQSTPNANGGASPKQDTVRGSHHADYSDRSMIQTTCSMCGAWRGAFGLEPTIELYVEHSVEILREILRVLKPDGVCFWNIGDSYSGGGRADHGTRLNEKQGSNRGTSDPKVRLQNWECKPKDLCLIPARVALTAQADGWWVRSDIIWAKPNPMPESVRDRPTDAYEHILMLAKSARYYWDAEAASEPVNGTAHARGNGVNSKARDWKTPDGWDTSKGNGGHGSFHKEGREKGSIRPRQNESFSAAVCGLVENRNLRNVWTFATQPYSGAHFATFPAELVIRCLQAATRPGDLVLDPFAGSGTVGEVAFNMGRRFVLCDLAYHDLQRNRIPPMALMQGVYS